MTDKFDKAFRDSAQSTDELSARLEVLQEASWGAETATQRNVNLLQDLTSVTGQAMYGLQEFGYVNEEQAESFRKAETAIQLLLIPYELYNIVKTYMIAAETAHVTSLMAETSATGAATTATWSFNAALMANPIVLVVLAVVGLIAVLVALQMKFDILNKILYGIDDLFKAIKNTIGDVIDAFDNLRAKVDVVSMLMKASPIGMAMELHGAIR
tara:strand:+ start:453 stop:1091 length:639 start_codon:yes stop_codon:yes gene_type:complete